jgi:hypothetical protein
VSEHSAAMERDHGLGEQVALRYGVSPGVIDLGDVVARTIAGTGFPRSRVPLGIAVFERWTSLAEPLGQPLPLAPLSTLRRALRGSPTDAAAAATPASHSVPTPATGPPPTLLHRVDAHAARSTELVQWPSDGVPHEVATGHTASPTPGSDGPRSEARVFVRRAGGPAESPLVASPGVPALEPPLVLRRKPLESATTPDRGRAPGLAAVVASRVFDRRALAATYSTTIDARGTPAVDLQPVLQRKPLASATTPDRRRAPGLTTLGPGPIAPLHRVGHRRMASSGSSAEPAGGGISPVDASLIAAHAPGLALQRRRAPGADLVLTDAVAPHPMFARPSMVARATAAPESAPSSPATPAPRGEDAASALFSVPPAPVDLERLAEQVSAMLIRDLAVERERRGIGTWH